MLTISPGSGYRCRCVRNRLSNHDVWLTDKTQTHSWALHEQQWPEQFLAHGFHPLHLATLQVNDVAFVGSMGWYDYSFRDNLGIDLAHYRAVGHF